MSAAQSCPTLWHLTDYSPPGSSVHGILQARILEWVAIPFSRGSSQPRDQTQVFCIAGRFFTIWATKEVHAPYTGAPKYIKQILINIKGDKLTVRQWQYRTLTPHLHQWKDNPNRKSIMRDSPSVPVVKTLHCQPTAGIVGSIPGGETKTHMPSAMAKKKKKGKKIHN